jgi:hypothetical protein
LEPIWFKLGAYRSERTYSRSLVAVHWQVPRRVASNAVATPQPLRDVADGPRHKARSMRISSASSCSVPYRSRGIGPWKA